MLKFGSFKSLFFKLACFVVSAFSFSSSVFALTEQQIQQLNRIPEQAQEEISSAQSRIDVFDVAKGNVKSNDFLCVYCGDLYGSDGGCHYLPDGTAVELGTEKPDANVHFGLYASKENSAFEGVDKVLLNVVRDDDGFVCFSGPCEFKQLSDNFGNFFKEEYLEKAQDKEFCEEVFKRFKSWLEGQFSKELCRSLAPCEVEGGTPVNGIYVGNFLTEKDKELFSKKSLGDSFTESNGRTYTFNFHRQKDDGTADAAVLATAKYKFNSENKFDEKK